MLITVDKNEIVGHQRFKNGNSFQIIIYERHTLMNFTKQELQ